MGAINHDFVHFMHFVRHFRYESYTRARERLTSKRRTKCMKCTFVTGRRHNQGMQFVHFALFSVRNRCVSHLFRTASRASRHRCLNH